MRQSDDEGSDGHQHTADRDDLGPMELGPKVTDESDDQQVAWRDRGGLEHQESAVQVLKKKSHPSALIVNNK